MKVIKSVTLLLFIFSCSKPKQDIPDYVLQKDKMKEVMVDVNLLESTLNLNLINGKKLQDAANMKRDLFQNHGTTQQQYDTSIYFYSHHPEIFKEVYDGVLQDLSKMQAEEATKK